MSGGEKDRGEKKEGGRYPRQKSRAARSMRWRGEVGRMRCQNHSIAKKRGKDREGPQKFPVFLPTGCLQVFCLSNKHITSDSQVCTCRMVFSRSWTLKHWKATNLCFCPLCVRPLHSRSHSVRWAISDPPIKQLLVSRLSCLAKVNYAFRRNARH